MKHDDLIAKNATPRAELERRLMSPNEPKTELEWFARREIERLRAVGRYARHGAGCQKSGHNPCTCGWDTLYDDIASADAAKENE